MLGTCVWCRLLINVSDGAEEALPANDQQPYTRLVCLFVRLCHSSSSITHTPKKTAALLARPDAQQRRLLLDARKREGALSQILGPFLPLAMEALRPLLSGGSSSSSSFTAARVTARVQGLLSTLDLGRALPAFLSSKHVRACLGSVHG